MAEELRISLDTYKLQLQQVEAALTAEPTNEELLKLKQDLVEVIALTNELINAQREAEDDVKGKSHAHKKPIQWSVGDKCMAPWSNNGQYYDCTIEELSENGGVSIRFDAYGNSDVTTIDKLKERPRGLEGGMSDKSLAEKLKTKKEQLQKQREYLKQKKQKKQVKMKELEEAREAEKNKWQNFNAKALKTKKGGIVKKSIFATPDGPGGRVGVGTCGISGRPMTDFTQAEKRKKK
uniref:Survival of motor neuron-related-splicing factor 30 n=1 Tax=Alona affinis TaxID=381656 RepID=A0A9N6WWQ3_9CRUS|nr:EOG090X0GY1 [Alona affinis]